MLRSLGKTWGLAMSSIPLSLSFAGLVGRKVEKGVRGYLSDRKPSVVHFLFIIITLRLQTLRLKKSLLKGTLRKV